MFESGSSFLLCFVISMLTLLFELLLTVIVINCWDGVGWRLLRVFEGSRTLYNWYMQV